MKREYRTSNDIPAISLLVQLFDITTNSITQFKEIEKHQITTGGGYSSTGEGNTAILINFHQRNCNHRKTKHNSRTNRATKNKVISIKLKSHKQPSDKIPLKILYDDNWKTKEGDCSKEWEQLGFFSSPTYYSSIKNCEFPPLYKHTCSRFYISFLHYSRSIRDTSKIRRPLKIIPHDKT